MVSIFMELCLDKLLNLIAYIILLQYYRDIILENIIIFSAATEQLKIESWFDSKISESILCSCLPNKAMHIT